MSNFLVLDDSFNGLLSIPTGTNHVNFSRFRKLEAESVFRAFSIKYVMRGKENYFINGQCYEVKESGFLLASDVRQGKATINSTSFTEGLCIDIQPELIQGVLASYGNPECLMPEQQLSAFEEFLLGRQFMEHVYNTSNTLLGSLLRKFASYVKNESTTISDIPDELFYQMAEALVLDQIPVYKSFRSLTAVKDGTRKEILRRLLMARDYMEDNYSLDFRCNDIARLVSLSEFHFFRLFRLVFDASPRQYVIKKRLEVALEMIRAGDMPITNIAFAVGFSDLQSFSKSFRKHFGYPPRELRPSNKQDLTT